MISPSGRLIRLHKGKIPQPTAPAPPVRESQRDVQIAGEEERRRAAGGSYAASIKRPMSLLALSETGAQKKSLLG